MNVTKFLNQLLKLSAALALLTVPSLALAQGEDNPTGVTGDFDGDVITGCRYDPYTGNARRMVADLNVWGAIGDNQLVFSRIYNSRYASTSYFSNYGNWRHSYQWEVTDNKNGMATLPTSYTISYPTGETVAFTSSTWDTGYFRGPLGTTDRLLISGDMLRDPTCYLYLIRSDGSQVVFTVTVTTVYQPHEDIVKTATRTYQATALIDKNGRQTTISYYNVNSPGVTQVTEPGGRWIKITYGTNGIDHIDSSYGQRVNYVYSTQTFQGVSRTVLTSVQYLNDHPTIPTSTTATYTYVTPVSGNYKPLLSTCDDPHFPGAMTKIQYVYQSGTGLGYGCIQKEQHPNGVLVSQMTVSSSSTRLETRSDGTARKFTFGTSTQAGLVLSVSNFSTSGTYTDLTSYGYDAKNYRNSVTDPEGRVTQFTNEIYLGRPTRITHPSDGSHQDFTYDDPAHPWPNSPYFLYSATDELGHTTTYKRLWVSGVAKGLPVEIDYPTPDGGVETFTYTTDGYLLPATHTLVSSSVAATGSTITYTYGGTNVSNQAWMWELGTTWGLQTGASMPTGLVTSVAVSNDVADGTRQMFYDVFGRLTKTQDAHGNQETFVTDHMGRVRSQTHPDSKSLVYGYDNYGNRNSVQNENLYTTTTTFDDYRRPISVVDPVNGSGYPTMFQYRFRDDAVAANEYAFTDRRPRLTTLPSGKKTGNDMTPDRRISAVYTAQWTNDCTYVKYGFDKSGRVLTKTVSKTTYGTGWNAPTTERIDVTNTYDTRGRLWKTQDAQANLTTFSYD